MCAATNFQTTLLNAEQLVPVKEPESVSTVDSSVGSTVENPDSSFDSRPQEPKGKGPSANSEHSHAPIMELDKPVLADITQNEESAHHNRGIVSLLFITLTTNRILASTDDDSCCMYCCGAIGSVDFT